MSRGINCPSAVPTPETRNRKTLCLDTRLATSFLPPSETTAAGPRPAPLCSGTEAIGPTATSAPKAAFRTAEPAGLTLAKAAESVFALGARLLLLYRPTMYRLPRSANCQWCVAAARCYRACWMNVAVKRWSSHAGAVLVSYFCQPSPVFLYTLPFTSA